MVPTKPIAIIIGVTVVIVGFILVTRILRSSNLSEGSLSPEIAFSELVATPLGLNPTSGVIVEKHLSARVPDATDYFRVTGAVGAIFTVATSDHRPKPSLRQVEGGLQPRPDWWPSNASMDSGNWQSTVIDMDRSTQFVFIIDTDHQLLYVARLGL